MSNQFTKRDGDRMCRMVLHLLQAIHADTKDDRAAPIDLAPWSNTRSRATRIGREN